LKGDEGVVCLLRECNIAKNGSRHVWPYFHRLRVDRDRLQFSALWCNQSIVGQRCLLSENIEHQSNALEAKHVISIGRNLNLELRGFLLAIDDRSF